MFNLRILKVFPVVSVLLFSLLLNPLLASAQEILTGPSIIHSPDIETKHLAVDNTAKRKIIEQLRKEVNLLLEQLEQIKSKRSVDVPDEMEEKEIFF